MNYFGCRDDFAVEVGSSIDHSDHCQLDFYARGIHLNRPDNQAYVGCALHSWPRFDLDPWARTDIFWELPLSTPTESLFQRVMADDTLYQRHLCFGLGPVTDSFSMLAFGRPTDFVLMFIRNDQFTSDDSDVPQWNCWTSEDATPVHWLHLAIRREEFLQICTDAYSCLSSLYSDHQTSTRATSQQPGSPEGT
jgi:hypothetical protein